MLVCVHYLKVKLLLLSGFAIIWGVIVLAPNNDSAQWSIKFSHLAFTQFLFSFGDKSDWLIATKDAVIGKYYSDEDMNIADNPYKSKVIQINIGQRMKYSDAFDIKTNKIIKVKIEHVKLTIVDFSLLLLCSRTRRSSFLK